MAERLDPVERVREYVQTIDAFTGSPGYGDVIHGLNYAELRRSDLRVILARLDAAEWKAG